LDRIFNKNSILSLDRVDRLLGYKITKLSLDRVDRVFDRNILKVILDRVDRVFDRNILKVILDRVECQKRGFSKKTISNDLDRVGQSATGTLALRFAFWTGWTSWTGTMGGAPIKLKNPRNYPLDRVDRVFDLLTTNYLDRVVFPFSESFLSFLII
jgi:hypothetical protein